jgi:hypothetical protein
MMTLIEIIPIILAVIYLGMIVRCMIQRRRLGEVRPQELTASHIVRNIEETLEHIQETDAKLRELKNKRKTKPASKRSKNKNLKLKWIARKLFE